MAGSLIRAPTDAYHIMDRAWQSWSTTKMYRGKMIGGIVPSRSNQTWP